MEFASSSFIYFLIYFFYSSQSLWLLNDLANFIEAWNDECSIAKIATVDF